MLTYHMEERGGKTKTVFLYESIRNEILSGTISAGEKLPSKRELAEHLSVSVVTVENAYALLAEEGYLTARERSGYYVNALPAAALREGNLPTVSSGDANAAPAHLAEEPFDTAAVPVPGLARMIRRILSEHPDIMLQKPPHDGCAVLRNAISDYLGRARGMQVPPSRIIIGSGAEYLYSLTVQLFGRDRIYGIEDPSYEKIEKVYLAQGARVVRLPMGKDGIDPEALEKTDATVLHITPFHSYPTGITASAQKRYAYLAWAREKDGYLIEDDFDSELFFFRRPIETLYEKDRSGRVIYMNTFSKSIAPGIRIAYMILPDALTDVYREKLGFYSCTVPVFDQYVLAEFIASGAFERHLGRLRRLRQ